jgi:hypothetical protein
VLSAVACLLMAMLVAPVPVASNYLSPERSIVLVERSLPGVYVGNQEIVTLGGDRYGDATGDRRVPRRCRVASTSRLCTRTIQSCGSEDLPGTRLSLPSLSPLGVVGNG